MPLIGLEIDANHRLVCVSMLPDQINECPQCGSKSFSLLGYFQRAYEQAYENSQPVKEGPLMAVDASQHISEIKCAACSIHTIIDDDLVFERESLIFDLQLMIAALQGKISISSEGKEWKN